MSERQAPAPTATSPAKTADVLRSLLAQRILILRDGEANLILDYIVDATPPLPRPTR